MIYEKSLFKWVNRKDWQLLNVVQRNDVAQQNEHLHTHQMEKLPHLNVNKGVCMILQHEGL